LNYRLQLEPEEALKLIASSAQQEKEENFYMNGRLRGGIVKARSGIGTTPSPASPTGIAPTTAEDGMVGWVKGHYGQFFYIGERGAACGSTLGSFTGDSDTLTSPSYFKAVDDGIAVQPTAGSALYNYSMQEDDKDGDDDDDDDDDEEEEADEEVGCANGVKQASVSFQTKGAATNAAAATATTAIDNKPDDATGEATGRLSAFRNFYRHVLRSGSFVRGLSGSSSSRGGVFTTRDSDDDTGMIGEEGGMIMPWCWVRKYDELTQAMRGKEVFTGFEEGHIMFPPSFRWRAKSSGGDFDKVRGRRRGAEEVHPGIG